MSGGAVDPVSITDHAHPQFAPEVAEMMALAEPFAEGLELTPQAVLDAASDQVGLDDFGDDAFREPLEVLLRAYREEAGLSPFGLISVHTQMVQLARNRLLLADLLRRHPQIHEVAVTAPIIIAGLPRTGTTHLHNLLAADPALRTMPYWESLEPFPMPQEAGVDGGVEPRIERTAAACAFLDQALPYFKRMHEMTPTHVHEEIQLLAMDFSTMFFETMALIPSWRDWYRAHDQTPHYRYLRTVLQAITFLRGGDRWVLKSPQHLEQFGPLMEVFPDATVVVTHRDPASVTLSLATMVAYTARLQVGPVDPPVWGAYWSERVEQMLLAAVADHALLPSGRTYDLRFADFMADDLAAVAAVYEIADQPLDDRARAAHRTYLEGHRRHRHGAVSYDPALFGIDPVERRSALAPYMARFEVGTA